MRGQAPVHDPVAVRVGDRLRGLPQQRQLVLRGHLPGLVRQVEVEALVSLVERVDQAHAQVVLHHVPGAEQPVVLQPGHDAVLVLGDLPDLRPGGRGRPGRRHEEPDSRPVRGRHAVERRPVLPAVALAERVLVDHPRAGLALAPLHDADPLHERGDDVALVRADRLVRGRGLKNAIGDARQAGRVLGAVEGEQVQAGRRRQLAPEPGVVQEHGLLHERHHVPRVRDRGVRLLRPVEQFVPELARQALRLAAGQLERRVLGAVPVSAPGQVVAAQGAGVVLQLDQVQAAAAEDQQVDLVPLAVAVAELEVRPRTERGLVRQQRRGRCSGPRPHG